MRYPRGWMASVGLIALGIALGTLTAAQQPRPAQAEKRNMELVGFHDLQARSAYQPIIHRQGEPYIAYVGHHGGAALNPLTGQRRRQRHVDPRRHEPEAAAVPRAHSRRSRATARPGGAQMVRVCDGSQLPRADKSKVYLLRTRGNTGHEIWDVTDPSKPHAPDRCRQRPPRHAQELVGMRHRHRLPGVRSDRAGAPTHDEDLRPERSGQAGVHPRLRAARAAAWRRRAAPPTGLHGAISTRAEWQPRLLRLRHRLAEASCRSSIARSC